MTKTTKEKKKKKHLKMVKKRRHGLKGESARLGLFMRPLD
jgi:hypothetical protein